jgi:hypothetical protein
MIRSDNVLALLLCGSLLGACGGSSKKADTAPPAPPPAGDPAAQAGPPAQTPGGPSSEDCDKLIDHALDLIEKSPQFTEADKEQIRKQRGQGGVRTSQEWKDAQAKCMTDMKKEDVQCALASKDFDEMNKCGSPAGPPAPAAKP